MDNQNNFNVLGDRIKTHLHEPQWQERLLEEISQQEPQNIAKVIRLILDRHSDWEQWLHRDLLLAGRCFAQHSQNLKVTDNSLCQEILQKLVELEVSDRLRVGNNVRGKLFTILCSFAGTDFETQLLQLLSEVLPVIIQWIEQYQDSEFIGAGIDALWFLIEGKAVKIPINNGASSITILQW